MRFPRIIGKFLRRGKYDFPGTIEESESDFHGGESERETGVERPFFLTVESLPLGYSLEFYREVSYFLQICNELCSFVFDVRINFLSNMFVS